MRGLNRTLRQRFAHGAGKAGVVFWAILAIVGFAGCNDDAINQVSLNAPAIAPLSIPELLEPAFDEEGVAQYDLKIGKSRHDYRQTALTDTYSYNGLPVLGPTLRLKTGTPAQRRDSQRWATS